MGSGRWVTCEKLHWSHALGVPRPWNLKLASEALGSTGSLPRHAAQPTPRRPALRGGWYPRCSSLHLQPSQVVSTRGGHVQLLTLGLLSNCVVQRTSAAHADLQTAEQGTVDGLDRGLAGQRAEQGGGGAVDPPLPLARSPAPPALLEGAADLSCDPGQIILLFGASVSPPTSRGSNSSQAWPGTRVTWGIPRKFRCLGPNMDSLY